MIQWEFGESQPKYLIANLDKRPMAMNLIDVNQG
jgi:hypothetical protein